jgi:hypothetical protein
MTRSITDDIPGWGALFNGRAGDGTASVSIVPQDRSILFCVTMRLYTINHIFKLHGLEIELV